jgi:hypothetical protein
MRDLLRYFRSLREARKHRRFWKRVSQLELRCAVCSAESTVERAVQDAWRWGRQGELGEPQALTPVCIHCWEDGDRDAALRFCDQCQRFAGEDEFYFEGGETCRACAPQNYRQVTVGSWGPVVDLPVICTMCGRMRTFARAVELAWRFDGGGDLDVPQSLGPVCVTCALRTKSGPSRRFCEWCHHLHPGEEFDYARWDHYGTNSLCGHCTTWGAF